MPIIRSILTIGNSKAVTIPKSWLTNAEDQTGRKVIALAMGSQRNHNTTTGF